MQERRRQLNVKGDPIPKEWERGVALMLSKTAVERPAQVQGAWLGTKMKWRSPWKNNSRQNERPVRVPSSKNVEAIIPDSRRKLGEGHERVAKSELDLPEWFDHFGPWNHVHLHECGFWVKTDLVTQKMWKSVTGESFSDYLVQQDAEFAEKYRRYLQVDAPVFGVTYHEAVDFCRKMTDLQRCECPLMEKFSVDIPSSEMWEALSREWPLTRPPLSRHSEFPLNPVVSEVGSDPSGLWNVLWQWSLDPGSESSPTGTLRGGSFGTQLLKSCDSRRHVKNMRRPSHGLRQIVTKML
jgi:hypothetical protein